MKNFKLFYCLAFIVFASILSSNKLFSQDNYFQENIKNWDYYKDSKWELIFKDTQTEYYLRLNTRASDFGRMAYLIAIHTVKDDDTPLYPYKKVKHGIVIEKQAVDYICNSLLPEVKERKPDTYGLIIRNYVKGVHLTGINPIDWMNKYEGELIKLTIASYGNGHETLAHYHMDTEYAMTVNEAKALRERLEKNPISGEERIKLEMATAEFVKNGDVAEDFQKEGFIYHDNTFWEKSWLWDYPNKGILSAMANEAAIDYRTNILKHIFHGNFDKIQKRHNIKEYIIAFLFTYSKNCEDYLGDYEHFKLTNTVTKVNNYGAVRGSWTEDLGSIKVPIRFKEYFNSNYSSYSYVDLCLKDMEDMIKKLGCDCKEINQIEENLYQLSQNKESIQALNKIPKGEECYFD